MAEFNQKIFEISKAFYDYSFERYKKEIENSNQPSKKVFPVQSKFQEDFQTNIDTVYNNLHEAYSSEQANYIYETLIANLSRQSENPAQSRIINLSQGSINTENLMNYSKKVEETLKNRHPEKFEVVNAELESKVLTNDSKKAIDFNNPEQKKTYLDNFYKGLADCKTREEKLRHIENDFGISLSDKSEKQQDEIISKFEMRQKIREIKDTLNKDEILKENSDLDDEQIDTLLENTAVEQYARENEQVVEEIKQTNSMIIELENIEIEIIKRNQGLLECNNATERQELENEINVLKNTKKEIFDELSLTDMERKKFSENIQKESQNSRLNESIKANSELEQNEDLSNLFTADKNSLEDDALSDLFTADENSLGEDALSDLFTADETPDKKIDEKQSILETKQIGVGINSILTGADPNDLKQEDYTIEIEEKENLWDKIKNRFVKIKDTIMKKLNLNNSKQLKNKII